MKEETQNYAKSICNDINSRATKRNLQSALNWVDKNRSIVNIPNFLKSRKTKAMERKSYTNTIKFYISIQLLRLYELGDIMDKMNPDTRGLSNECREHEGIEELIKSLNSLTI